MSIDWQAVAGSGKTALVLAGGGARGAYQVGAIHGLADHGFEPDLVAGTSIGALNGSMVAQEPTFSGAAARLEAAWEELGHLDVVKADFNKIGEEGFSGLAAAAAPFANALRKWISREIVRRLPTKKRAWLDPGPMERFIQEKVSPNRLRQGRPLWVAATRLLVDGSSPVFQLIESLRARIAEDVDYLRLDQIDDDKELLQALLASAAIPVAFPSREVNGNAYADGGVVDNVPLESLLSEDCSLAVVIHLSNGSIWKAPDRDDLTVLEIRPRSPIQKSQAPIKGWLESLLDFSPKHISELRDMGFSDANDMLNEIDRRAETFRKAREAKDRLRESTKKLANDPPLLDD